MVDVTYLSRYLQHDQVALQQPGSCGEQPVNCRGGGTYLQQDGLITGKPLATLATSSVVVEPQTLNGLLRHPLAVLSVHVLVHLANPLPLHAC